MSSPAPTLTYKIVKNGAEVRTGLDLAQAVELRKQIKEESPQALVTLMLDKPSPALAGEEVLR
ncbi:MAG: hypothetical protein KJ077_08295 [Anaerolineae bacterium]|nr:hypothetical protein [Anaerolineae bacterium]